MQQTTATLVSIGAAFIAGGFLAATGVLQQRAAATRPPDEQLSPRLLINLARNRTWRHGIATAVASYGFQAVALAFGPLAVVQPVILSELLFAVPISVRLHHMRLQKRDWAGVVAVVAGLAIGITASSPRQGDPLPPLPAWGIALGGVGLLAGAAVVVSRVLRGPQRASLYAFAAAAVLALQSALFAATIALLKQGLVAVFTTWQPYALVPVTVVGMLLVESAYQAGPLAASMPVMDATEPSVAIAIGVALFGEHIATGVGHLAGTGLGLLLLFGGIVTLDTSPVVQRLHRKERTQQRETEKREAEKREAERR